MASSQSRPTISEDIDKELNPKLRHLDCNSCHDDDSDAGSVGEDENLVNLGFVEKTDRRLLRSHMFPSKVGGWPAWLSLSPLPHPDELKCHLCGAPCTFLLQVYAPISALLPLTFHRTLFVFVCRSSSCNKLNTANNFLVFRSQLPRHNRFYSSEPPSLSLTPPTTPPPSSSSSSQQPPNTAASANTYISSMEDDVDGAGGDGSSSGDGDGVLDILSTEEAPSAVMYQSVCVVCGAAGPKRCGGCLNVTYCGKEHQVLDWRYCHRNICKNKTTTSATTTHTGIPSRDQPGVLFDESELVTEPEEREGASSESEDGGDDDDDNDNTGGGSVGGGGGDGGSTAERKPKGKQLQLRRGGGGGGGGDRNVADLEAYARKETTDDKQFLKFRRRIRPDPDQVLRYQLGGETLWVSSENIPSPQTIPPCQSCGAARIFEFQVMPQLLSHLGVDTTREDSLDWGTLAIYTCSTSCDIGGRYVPEFLWKQDYANNNNNNDTAAAATHHI
ncbi:programmed cell death protein 2-like [Argonauta hians]